MNRFAKKRVDPQVEVHSGRTPVIHSTAETPTLQTMIRRQASTVRKLQKKELDDIRSDLVAASKSRNSNSASDSDSHSDWGAAFELRSDHVWSDSDDETTLPATSRVNNVRDSIDAIREEVSKVDTVIALDQLDIMKDELETLKRELKSRDTEVKQLQARMHAKDSRLSALELERALYKADAGCDESETVYSSDAHFIPIPSPSLSQISLSLASYSLRHSPEIHLRSPTPPQKPGASLLSLPPPPLPPPPPPPPLPRQQETRGYQALMCTSTSTSSASKESEGNTSSEGTLSEASSSHISSSNGSNGLLINGTAAACLLHPGARITGSEQAKKQADPILQIDPVLESKGSLVRLRSTPSPAMEPVAYQRVTRRYDAAAQHLPSQTLLIRPSEASTPESQPPQRVVSATGSSLFPVSRARAGMKAQQIQYKESPPPEDATPAQISGSEGSSSSRSSAARDSSGRASSRPESSHDDMTTGTSRSCLANRPWSHSRSSVGNHAFSQGAGTKTCLPVNLGFLSRRRKPHGSQSTASSSCQTQAEEVTHLLRSSLETSEELRKRLALISAYYENVVNELQANLKTSDEQRKMMERELSRQSEAFDRSKKKDDGRQVKNQVHSTYGEF